MNILIINKYFFVSGGPERYMFSIMELLERQGHTVIPLSIRLNKNQPSKYDDMFLPPPFQDDETSHFQNASLTLVEKMKLTKRAIYFTEARDVVAEIVERENIDVVYLLNICNYISPSVIDGAHGAGARVIMRLSDYNFVCASYHFFRDGEVCTKCLQGMHHAVKYRCMRGSLSLSIARYVAMVWHQKSKIYSKVDAFVAPSQFMANSLVKFGMPQDKVNWVPSFVNLDQYEANFDAGEYVLYFGRLDDEKGVNILLDAWRLVNPKFGSLWIVGSGEAEEELKVQASRLGLENVVFQPFMKKQDLLEVVRNARFVIVPSLWHDNAPMATYEAMACGKPVVGSKLGGLMDQIENGETGILVEPGNPEMLAKTISGLWNDDKRICEMGIRARQRMETTFSADKHLSTLNRIFMV